MYRHSEGQSQSSRTPRKLLVKLRLLAFERLVLSDKRWRNGFAVWGAGRDGKDFVKFLSKEFRECVKVMVDVDEKKISAGFYHNRDMDIKIPIAEFKELRPSRKYGSLPVVACVAMVSERARIYIIELNRMKLLYCLLSLPTFPLSNFFSIKVANRRHLRGERRKYFKNGG